MTIFALKGSLEEITPAQLSEQTCSAVFITDSAHAEETLRTANITYEGVISLRDVVFCKIESQPFCLAGTLSIPKLLDIKGSRHRIQFFIDNKNMVIIDDEEFSLRLVQRIQRSRHNQRESREHFIYNFFSEFMLRDTELLAEHEQKLMELEENVNIALEFACKQVKETSKSKVSNRHDGYGIASEFYAGMKLDQKKVDESMKDFLRILPTEDDAKAVEAASSLKNAATGLVLQATKLAAQADRIMHDLYEEVSNYTTPVEDYLEGQFEDAEADPEAEAEEEQEDAE